VKDGAYLRVCTKWGESPTMVPVKNHTEALRKAKAICGCVAAGDHSKSCSQKVGGKKTLIRTKTELKRLKKKPKEKAECLKWSKPSKSGARRCLRRASED